MTQRFKQLKEKFEGAIAYPLTPFKKINNNLIIDEESYRKLIHFLIKNKVLVIRPCGGSGEIFSLNIQEWKTLVKKVELLVE